MARETYKAKAKILFDGDDTPYRQAVARIKKQAEKDGQAIQRSLFAGLAAGAGVAFAVRKFATFEQNLQNVAKTSGMAGDELKAFGRQIQDMAKDSVFGTGALLDTAAAAAQLGVTGTDNILRYTDAVAKLAAASDFSPDEAAFALARLGEVAGESFDKVGNLAATFTALGNSLPVTEAELQDSAIAVAAAGRSYGLTADQALGLAAAFGAAGQASFANGTAVGRFFSELGKASRDGGDKLEAFAEVMGVTAQEAIRLYGEDAVGAFRLYTEGLGKFGNEADAYLVRSGILEGKAQRLFKSIGEVVGEALETAQQGFEDGTAHQEEYRNMTDSLEGSTRKLIAALGVLTEEIGKKFEPVLRPAVDAMHQFVAINEEPLVKASTAIGRLGGAYIAFSLIVASSRLAVAKLKLGLIALSTANVIPAGLKTLGLGFQGIGSAIGSAYKALRTGHRFAIGQLRYQARRAAAVGKEIAGMSRYMKMFGTTAGAHLRSAGLGMKAFTGAINIAKGAVRLLGTALKLSLFPLLVFFPEVARFIYRVWPDAMKYARIQFKKLSNSIAIAIEAYLMVWKGAVANVLEGADFIAQKMNQVFGTDLPEASGAAWREMEANSAETIDKLIEDNERLGLIARGTFRDMAADAKKFGEEVKASAAAMAGIEFSGKASAGPNVPVVPSSGLGTPLEDAASTDESTEQKAAEAAAEAAKIEEARLKAHQRALREYHWMRVEGDEMAEQARIDAQNRELAAAKHAAQKRIEAETRIEADGIAARTAMRHAAAAEQMAQSLLEAQDLADAEAEIEAHKLETELTAHGMKMAGLEEAQTAHYERMREIELAYLEAKRLADEEEMARMKRLEEAELASYKQLMQDKIGEDMKQASKTLAIFGKRSKTLKKMSADLALAEAVYSASTRAPVDVAKTYGQYSAYLPPPGGQILGGIAAAAVAAKYAAAIKEAHAATRMRDGGIVPGAFSLNDSQRALLQPGETITPRKNYKDVEEGIRARIRQEDYPIPELPDINVNVGGDEDLAHFLSVQIDAAEAVRA